MNKHYWWILIVFALSQLVFPLPIAIILGATDLATTEAELMGLSIFISFTIAFLIISAIAYRAPKNPAIADQRMDVGGTIGWSLIGIVLAFAAQYIAAILQMTLLGIEPGSENTQQIVDMTNAVPILAFAVAIFGPVSEEIVFRMVIFGALLKRFGFWIAAVGNGLIFAVVHWDFENILVYLAMAIVFSYLYYRTGRIIVPIVAHIGINSFVMLVQVVFGEQIQDFLERMEEMEQSAAFIMAVIGRFM
ncbi:CPBP family intramembrane metalloprotease [Paenalkalicoccus suaedae]|uniref:CPBP family intramembrane metalloprotease n=1 Tax=Paenalkalicoccus suaedae TaxID=2592382 RepID=A0A859FBS7_9BACI|nr:type II CAAX endopeptidase family protein [Paenalkalicoccus suaedae]QKS70278.1 CPBP family intramembrane metalloprotease [Paenalkalicoccus suaedae]